jgi:hypothetical protein
MSDNPLDRIPSHDRVSLRAVLVKDGEDPGPALAAAGIFDPVALPVTFGEPDIGFGDGITPNLTAVLETHPGPGDVLVPASGARPASAEAQSGAAASGFDDRPGEPATINLPAAYGMQPLAPVRPSGDKSGGHLTGRRPDGDPGRAIAPQ